MNTPAMTNRAVRCSHSCDSAAQQLASLCQNWWLPVTALDVLASVKDSSRAVVAELLTLMPSLTQLAIAEPFMHYDGKGVEALPSIFSSGDRLLPHLSAVLLWHRARARHGVPPMRQLSTRLRCVAHSPHAYCTIA